MRSDIITYLEKEIENRAKNPQNKFGIGAFYFTPIPFCTKL